MFSVLNDGPFLNMSVEKLISLDCTVKANKVKIQNELKDIKPLQKYREENTIPLRALERFLEQICRKYEVYINYISPVVQPHNVMYYNCCAVNLSSKQYLSVVSGLTLYEVLCKLILLLWDGIQTGQIKKRSRELINES